ncbi:MAG: YicC family protein [Lachnospiraceae bacterium]|nr:YicC family protein [Lachnospiraceae bacterium]MCR4929614.1 YicC family protein [Lachnospiraceae bacterium]
MIKSMTGYGRSEKVTPTAKCTVEIKSVNHRYLDLSIKLPRKLNMFEAEIRDVLKDYIQRGKVDVYVSFEDYSKESVNIKYNSEIAAEYVKYFAQMAEEFELDNDIRVSALSRMPEVLVSEDENINEEEIWKLVKDALTEACDAFVVTRIKEGENLKNDLLEKLDSMSANVAFIEERYPQIIEDYKNRLTSKIKEVLDDKQIDESRILTEVCIYSDKVCVDEEMVRLKSHIDAVREALTSGGAVGKRLDFLAQELNREANTTLSKSTDIEISNVAITIKTEIEKIREQIQNIE